jgi:hypothetical protein
MYHQQHVMCNAKYIIFCNGNSKYHTAPCFCILIYIQGRTVTAKSSDFDEFTHFQYHCEYKKKQFMCGSILMEKIAHLEVLINVYVSGTLNIKK